MKRNILFTLVCLLLLSVLAGCTTNADTAPVPSPSAGTTGPAATGTAMPTESMMPSAEPDASASPGTMGASTNVSTVQQVMEVSQQVKEELVKLSEVDDAAALVISDKAVVGLTFTDEYKSGLTNRVKDMVKDRINAILPGIDNVTVTETEEQMEAIRKLQDSVTDSTVFETLENQVDALIKTIDSNSGTPDNNAA